MDDDRPFLLQLQAAKNKGPQSISDFIRRVTAEPGGFRALNADDLRREIEAKAKGDQSNPSDQDVNMTTDASDSGANEADAQDVAAARDEIIRAIMQTQQTSMFALDFVSLLLSKENPAQAITTLSPALRDMVGVGTLGATMLDAPTPLARSRIPDNRMVAIGKRINDFDKLAEEAASASRRLRKENDAEKRFWSEIQGVAEGRWPIFRMPNESQTLGVQFGSSNTSPAFKNSGTAALRRAEDGSVELDNDDMSRDSKRVQVRIVENGQVVGASKVDPPLSADAPLQDRVLEARNTMFAKELWEELRREARSELDNVVRIYESAIAYDFDDTKIVELHLVTLGDQEASPRTETTGLMDDTANQIYFTINLLLSAAHWNNAMRQSEPSTAKGASSPYYLLRPVIAHANWHSTIQNCTKSLLEIMSVLRSANWSPAELLQKEPATSLVSVLRTQPLSTLTGYLLNPPPVQYDLTLSSMSRLRILVKPAPHSSQVLGAAYAVSYLPPLKVQDKHPFSNFVPRGAVNPLFSIAPRAVDDYTTLDDLLVYLHGAVAAAIAHYTVMFNRRFPIGGAWDLPAKCEEWAMGADSRSIVDKDTGELGIRFEMTRNDATGALELVATCDYLQKPPRPDSEYGDDEDAPVLSESDRNAIDIQGRVKVREVYRWPDSNGQNDDVDLTAALSLVLGNGPRADFSFMCPPGEESEMD
jgi:mediator of RNA polymerase II transcription subunit 17